MTSIKEEEVPLFVEENENLMQHNQDEESQAFTDDLDKGESDEDPVVDSVPLVINSVPDPLKHSLHLLQFIGKNKSASQDSCDLKASVKEQSNFIELSTPINTSKFYDEARAEEWGTVIKEQTLSGVFDKTDGELYAGQITQHDGQKIIALTPIDSTVQLRPSFRHLNHAEFIPQPEPSDQQKNKSVHILQTSAKQNGHGGNGDNPSSHSIGESLKQNKKLEEEESLPLQWRDIDDLQTKEYAKQLSAPNCTVLETNSSYTEYVDAFTHL